MKDEFVFLSRTIDNSLICYNGTHDIEISPASKINNGDGTNNLFLKMKNHCGTHIDFPSHFIKTGKTIDDYNADYFIFKHPFVLDIPMTEGIYITAELIVALTIPPNSDLIIIRTGYGKYYSDDKYWNNNPGIDVSVVNYLKSNFPHLRAVGMDFISINAYCDKVPGRYAHKAFLTEPAILIIEDMLLPDAVQFLQVITAPLRIVHADGTPCSILAEVAE
jgi:kynurenine formamidase